MTDRIRLDDLTSDQLDQLYNERDQAREGESILGARVNDWVDLAKSHQHWGQRRWNAWKSARARAKEQRDRAERAETALAHVRALHHQICPLAKGKAGPGFSCSMCTALDEPAPDQPATTPIVDRPFRTHRQPGAQHNDGPSIAECQEADRRWPLEQSGE